MFYKASRLLLVACPRYTTGVKMDDTPERCCPCPEPPFGYKKGLARIDMSYEDNEQRVVTATSKKLLFGYRGLEMMSMSNDLLDRLKLTSTSRESLFGYGGVASGLNIEVVSKEVGMTTGNNLLDPFKLNELRATNAAGSESMFGHKGMEAILDKEIYCSNGLVRRRKAKIAASSEGLFGYGGVATGQNVGAASNGVGVTATGNDLLDPLKRDDLRAMNAAGTESLFGHKGMEAILDKDCHLSSGLGWGRHKAKIAASSEGLFGYGGVATGQNVGAVSSGVGVTATGNDLLDPLKRDDLRAMNAAGIESLFGHKRMEAILDKDCHLSSGLGWGRHKAKIAASSEGLFGYGGVATGQNVGALSNGVGVTATGNDLLDPLKRDIRAMNAAGTESLFGHKGMEAILDKDCHLSSGLGWGRHKASESRIGDRGVTVSSLGNQVVPSELIHPKRPKSFDWREHGAVTAVRDQKLCGCCFIISAVAATEALRKIKTGILEQLSIQQVIDCDLLRKNDGCYGGLAWQVFEYIILYGLTTEELYPFTSWNFDPTKKKQPKDKRYKKCRHGLKKVANIRDWTTVTADPDSFESGVLINPLVVALHVNHFFTGYTGGIISLEDLPPPTPSQIADPKFELHAVLLVGYGEDETGKRFWILKNSCGVHWGEGGYFRLERDVRHPWGVGGLTRTHGIYPTGYIHVIPAPPTLWDACLEKLRKLSFLS